MVYGDEHPPPHFHAQAPDGEAIVTVSNWKVRNSGVGDTPLKAALAWARLHEQDILDDWNRQNPREVS